MAAVHLIEREEAEAGVADVFEAAERHFGQVPNLVRALANNPTLCRSITEFMIAGLRPGRVDWGFKELLILKTMRSMKSYYGYGAHEKLATELGVPVEKMGDLANSLWQTSSRLPEPERVMLEFATQVARDANDVKDEHWQRMKAHWDNGQLLEMNAVITTFIQIGRIGDTLGVCDPVLFTKPVSSV